MRNPLEPSLRERLTFAAGFLRGAGCKDASEAVQTVLDTPSAPAQAVFTPTGRPSQSGDSTAGQSVEFPRRCIAVPYADYEEERMMFLAFILEKSDAKISPFHILSTSWLIASDSFVNETTQALWLAWRRRGMGLQ